VKEGPRGVLELLSWGAHFDKKIGNPYDLAFTREGGTAFRGSFTRSAMRRARTSRQTLINTVRAKESIRTSEKSFVIDLMTERGDRCLAHWR
jgi:aspartate oxidase